MGRIKKKKLLFCATIVCFFFVCFFFKEAIQENSDTNKLGDCIGALGALLRDRLSENKAKAGKS